MTFSFLKYVLVKVTPEKQLLGAMETVEHALVRIRTQSALEGGPPRAPGG